MIYINYMIILIYINEMMIIIQLPILLMDSVWPGLGSVML